MLDIFLRNPKQLKDWQVHMLHFAKEYLIRFQKFKKELKHYIQPKTHKQEK